MIGANSWHSGGIDGTGVKLAVIDLGFSGYASKLGTELPASVTTMNFRTDGDFFTTDHGTNVAEVAHDVAPGADLYLLAISSSSSLANATSWASSQGIDVVNHSISFFLHPGDGTGPVNDVVDYII